MSRFFVKKENIFPDRIVIDDKEDVHHIAKVLRLNEGDICDVSDCQEWEYKVEIISISKSEVQTKIRDKQKFTSEPQLKITLFQSLPKQGKMETIIQKSVELGVHEVVPMFTARTVVTQNESFGKKIDRWQKVSGEAVKQCRRGIIPKIEDGISFAKMLERLKSREFDEVIFPYENEEAYSIKSALQSIKEKPKSVAIIIGSEGGFSDEEAKALAEIGVKAVTLGKTILRTETAGPAAIAMVMYELELC